MLDNLKLLHARIGVLIEQAEGGGYTILEASRSRVRDREAISILVERFKPVTEVKTCDHLFRRMASGEYLCTRPDCGIIIDDVENEQWT